MNVTTGHSSLMVACFGTSQGKKTEALTVELSVT